MTEIAEAETSAGRNVQARNNDAGAPTMLNMLWRKLLQLDDWSRGYLERKYGQPGSAADVDEYNPDIVLMEDYLAGKSMEEMTGTERLRLIYFKEHGLYPVEREVMWRSMLAAGIGGFFVGGIMRQRDSLHRFETYAAGKSLGNARNAMRRKLDYATLMFAKNGLGYGLRVGAVAGTSMFIALNLTTYRYKYCSYYFPLFAGLSSALMMARGGVIGLFYGFCFGLIPGFSLSGAMLAFSAYKRRPVNECYWTLRDIFNTELHEKAEYQQKVQRIMKTENLYFEWQAKKRLYEIEAEKKTKGEEIADALADYDDKKEGNPTEPIETKVKKGEGAH